MGVSFERRHTRVCSTLPVEGLGTRRVNSRFKLAYAWPHGGGSARCGAHTSDVGCSFPFLALLPRKAGLGPGSYARQWCNSTGRPPLCLPTRSFPLLGHYPLPPGVWWCFLSRSGKIGRSTSLGVLGSSARSYVLWEWHLRSTSCARGWLYDPTRVPLPPRRFLQEALPLARRVSPPR